MSKNLIFNICATCGLLFLTGCSLFQGEKSRDERIDNVAYSVPESVAKSGVDVRKKPTKPSWTEDVYGHKELEFKPARPAPISSSGGEVYVVKKGDTIYGIARCFGFSPRKIMELNDMDRSSKLYVGQTMKLPGKISKGEFKQPVKKSDVKRSDTIKYTVERGDSLSKIARMHSMKTSELKELNNLSSDFIREGQQLDVHKPKCHIAKGASTDVKKCVLDADGLYVIQQGDSLDRIARSFGVSSKALKEANGIDDPLKLQIGKKLIIPSKSHVSGPTIQQGGTATVSKGAGSGASGAAQSNADSDDFFETFDSIKVFEVGN